ncbi:MAG: hypothetical protein ABJC09_11430 [Terriglobia bacterium]
MNLIDSVLAAPQTDAVQMKRKGAAKDFEALLVTQMLRSVREEGSGWLGTGEDKTAEAAFGLAEEQLSKALTSGKGFGLAKLIETGLKAREAAQTATPVIP